MKLFLNWFCLIWIFCGFSGKNSCHPTPLFSSAKMTHLPRPSWPPFWVRSCSPVPTRSDHYDVKRNTLTVCVCVVWEREREKERGAVQASPNLLLMSKLLLAAPMGRCGCVCLLLLLHAATRVCVCVRERVCVCVRYRWRATHMHQTAENSPFFLGK